MKHWIKAIGTAAVLALSAGAGSAATCGSDGRVLTLTTTPEATCLLAAQGNLGGNGANDVFMSSLAGAGYVLLDKSDSPKEPGDPLDPSEGALTSTLSLVSGVSGDFTIDLDKVIGTFSKFAIGFKMGGNQNQLLTAFVFELPAGVTTGTWSWSLQSNELSHANLYGLPEPDMPPVPLPAAGWLLIAGLGGLAALRRTRKA
jgi:hypothetical protein